MTKVEKSGYKEQEWSSIFHAKWDSAVQYCGGGVGGGVGAACSDEMVSSPGAQLKYARARQGAEALWR